MLISSGILASCGDAKKGIKTTTTASEEVETQKSQLEQALTDGNLKQASVVADSMSLFVDDFTPEQTVQVLTTFIKVYKDAVARHESRKALETIRKYVDVYDIALSTNPKDTKTAFQKAMRNNPELDFGAVAIAFREKLSNYDSLQDGSLNRNQSDRTDSVTKTNSDTVAEKPQEIPLELRPAE